MKKIFFISSLFILIFLRSSYSFEATPLNSEQKNLINQFNMCEEYSQCAFENIKKLVEISNQNTEFYEIMIYNFVELLILIGEKKDWIKYEKFIDNFLLTSEEKFNSSKVYISALWGWRLYSVKEIRNYDKSLKLLNNAIKIEGNVEMTGNAYYSLGVIYRQGRAVKKDILKSIEYFNESAKRGDTYSYHAIANLYLFGTDNFKKDFDKTIQYLKMANISWIDNSNFDLLKILYNKNKLPKDVYELESWVLSSNIENKSELIKILSLGFEIIGDYKNAYKYHYITTKITTDSYWSEFELNNYTDDILTKEEIDNLIHQSEVTINLLNK